MTLAWLVILLIYGATCGWNTIPPLLWWLMVPFIVQDSYDLRKK